MPGGPDPQAPPEMDISDSADSASEFHGFENANVGNDEGADHEEPPATMRQYTAAFKAPYTVYIRDSPNGAKLNPLSCSSYIHKKYKSVIDVSQNHGKMRVQLSDMKEANALAADPRLEHVLVYIPAGNVQCDGVINFNDVNDLENLDELVKYGVGRFSNQHLKDVPILSTLRLSKRSDQEENVHMLTNMVKLSFAGRIVPDFVVTFGLRIRVRPFYNNPMFCDNCQQFNHTAKFCKKNAKCAVCHGAHTTAKCDSPQGDRNLCPYCRTPHAGGQRNCPHFVEVRACYKQRQERRQHNRYMQAVASAAPAPAGPAPAINNLDEANFPVLANRFAAFNHSAPSTSADAQADDANTGEQSKKPLNPPANPWATARKTPSSANSNKRKREQATKSAKPATIPTSKTSQQPPNSAAPGFRKCDSLKDSIVSAVRNAGIPNNWLIIIEAVLFPILDIILPQLSSLLASIVPMLLAGRP